MIGRWFRKSKERISVEELAQLLTEGVNAGQEDDIAPDSEEIQAALRPLGVNLVRASAVFWAATRTHFLDLQQLRPERCATFGEVYYEKVWEGIVSRFGAQKAQYDEFVWDLGGLILPDKYKRAWARQSGVHDVLSIAVDRITQAADEYHAANESDKDAAYIAFGKVVGPFLFGGHTDLDVIKIFFAFTTFMSTAVAFSKFFNKLETDGHRVY